jgi:hypothetical protein
VMSTPPTIATTVTAGCGITFRHTMFEAFHGAGTSHGLPTAPTVRLGGAAVASALDQLAPPASSEPLRVGYGATRSVGSRCPHRFHTDIFSHDSEDHGVVINGWEDARR